MSSIADAYVSATFSVCVICGAMTLFFLNRSLACSKMNKKILIMNWLMTWRETTEVYSVALLLV